MLLIQMVTHFWWTLLIFLFVFADISIFVWPFNRWTQNCKIEYSFRCKDIYAFQFYVKPSINLKYEITWNQQTWNLWYSKAQNMSLKNYFNKTYHIKNTEIHQFSSKNLIYSRIRLHCIHLLDQNHIDAISKVL